MLTNSKQSLLVLIVACGILLAATIAVTYGTKLYADNGSELLLAEEDLMGNGETQCVLRTRDLSFLMTYRAPDRIGYGPRVNHFDIIYASPQVIISKLSLRIATSDGDRVTAEAETKPLGVEAKMQALFAADSTAETFSLFDDMVKMSFVQSLNGTTVQDFTFDFSSSQNRNEKEKFVNCIAQAGQPNNRDNHPKQTLQQCVSSCEIALNQSVPYCPAPNYDYSYEDPNAPDVGNVYVNSAHEEHIQCLQSAERILIRLEPAFNQCLARCQEYLE